MDPVINVENVSKSYKRVQALSGVSLSVGRGRIFGLIGPDGAGKSTLIHIITGVLGFSEGSVRVMGADVRRDPEVIKKSIGFLPQGLGLSLAQELSVEENVDYFAEINHVDGREREERKGRLLAATGLDSFRDRPAKNLSGGMKQKLALACTLMHEPPAIFLDEPTTGVDPISRREIWTLVNEMVKQDGLTVFLTTSYMDEAERCHEVVLMHRGRIIAQGSPSELPGALDGSFAEIAVAGMEEQQSALRALKRMPGIRSAYPLGEKIGCVYTETSCEAIRRYAEGEGARVESVSEASPCLEDVFLSKISEEGDAVDESALEEFFFEGEGSGAGGCEKREVMIETQNLEKRFGSFVAVDDLTFSIKSGEIFGFLGPNGAGKTTTIKMLCGLFPPTSGRGTIGGLDFFKEQFKIKKSIGYMSQKFSLYRDLTVEENIVLYGGIYGVPRKELARRKGLILKMAGLSGEGDAITGELPMGIKQRLALGCAIIHKPPCIFLDEPTSGVDPAARRQFWDIIYLLSRRMGVTVLVTTHYMDEAEHCDRLSLMTRGKLVALGHPSELKGRVSKDIGKLLEICTPDPFSAVDCLRGEYRHCFVFGAGVHLYTSDPKREALRIKSALEAHGVEVSGIGEGAIPFEDVFVYFCENVEG